MEIRVKQATKDGYEILKGNGVVDLSNPSSKTRRGRVQAGGANLTHPNNNDRSM